MPYIDEEESEPTIDVSTFQHPLKMLAETLAQKVRREAPGMLSAPSFVAVDLHVLTRQAMHTYDLFFYLHADDRREGDCYWRIAYSVLSLPLIRNMIDDLYNITSILQAPAVNGAWFRKSGFHKALEELDGDEKRYGGQPKWDAWIQRRREHLDLLIRACGLTMVEVLAQNKWWPTLGRYINDKPGGTMSPHQSFLDMFAHGKWREYSAMAHEPLKG